MFLIQKYTQYKAAQAEQQKRKVTEKELTQLNHKIDKLLTKLDEHEPEIASNQDEECVVCVNAKATMQTYPCGHRVICRKCFVKTIQTAVAQRLLPLRCVICRAKILRLKHVNGDEVLDDDEPTSRSGGPNGSGESIPSPTSSSSSSSSPSTTAFNLRQTISHWYKVPQSDSLYSVTSNTSRASSASSGSSASSSFNKVCASTFASFRKSHSSYSKMGYEQLNSPSSPSPPTFRKLLFSKKSNSNNNVNSQNTKSSSSSSSSNHHNSSNIPVSKKQSRNHNHNNNTIPTSRSTSHLQQKSYSRGRSPSSASSPSSSNCKSHLMPKKENRIVPVQPPKPIPMGLSSVHNTNNINNNNNSNPSNFKPTRSPSPTSPSTFVSTTIISPSPLKGKFKLVQEFQREFHTGREKCLNQYSQSHSSNNHNQSCGNYNVNNHLAPGQHKTSKGSSPRRSQSFCNGASGVVSSNSHGHTKHR